jgi:lipid-A-disaccharide synthase-like uncharacterized protein
MRRPLILIELALLAAVLGWAGWLFARSTPMPPGAVDLKVQLRGAADRAFLLREADGALRYEIRLADGTAQRLPPDAFAQRLYDDQSSRGAFAVLLNVSSPLGFLWVALGLLGQVLFTGRIVVQWLASEKAQRSVVPVAFWWMSLLGASMLLAYFLWRRDPIGVLGQATGWFIYVRNLGLIRRERGVDERAKDVIPPNG